MAVFSQDLSRSCTRTRAVSYRKKNMTPEEKKKVFNGGDFRSLSDNQRRVFRQVVDDLEARGLFRATDVSIIASYSRNVILARQASKDLDKYGIMLTETDKYHGSKMKQNPAVDILQKAQTAMEKTAALLGLTPTGRKRLKDEERAKTVSQLWEEWIMDGKDGSPDFGD